MWRVLAAAALLLFVPAGVAQTASEQVPSEAAQWIAKGDAAAAQNDLTGAGDDYHRADAIGHHRCVTCLLRLGGAERGLGELSQAASSYHLALAAAQAEPGAAGLVSAAAEQLGDALSAEAGFDHPGARQLSAAEAAYRTGQAVASAHDRPTFQFKLAVIVMRQNQTADGLAELGALAQDAATPLPLRQQARAIVANPGLALEPLAPEFTFTADDGTAYSPDSLRGKVVLLDFWGTWCPPCREAVPMLLGIEKRYGKRSDFVMLGISSDASAQLLSDFTARHHMNWPEYLDPHLELCRSFGVNEFPTYIVLRRDGSVAALLTGLDYKDATRISGETQFGLEAAIDHALKPKP